MAGSLTEVRHRFRSWLTPSQQRGVRVLAWASVVSLVGVSVTGLWQFFGHRSDPGWYGYEAGGDAALPPSSSGGVAELHSLFSASVAIIALVVTDRFELGSLAIRLWTLAHVLTLPILIGVIWVALTRVDDAGS